MDTRILAVCELSNDLLFQKIRKERLSYYIDEPLRIGTEAAAAYAGKNLYDLYAERGIGIRFKEDGSGAFGMAYRGQITLEPGNCAAVIFRSSIRALAGHSFGPGLPGLDETLAEQIHLAHEFFHFLEFESGNYVPQVLEPVTTLKVLGFERKARINRCSEVAAHAFAKVLLELPVLPNYYDYRYLVNTGKMTGEAFEAMLGRYHTVLGGGD